jgi:hypothetical protein
MVIANTEKLNQAIAVMRKEFIGDFGCRIKICFSG